jgi:hypothetical protein
MEARAATPTVPLPTGRTAAAQARARRARPLRLAAAILLGAALVGVGFFAWRARREVGTRPGLTTALVQAPAKIAVDFQHPLSFGAFKLWVDDELAIDADLSGRVTKTILGLKLRKGSLEQILEVPPGRHDFRVRVAWQDNVKDERTRATLAPSATRLLEIRLGRLRQDLSLEWR